ncbi:Histidine-tRNA ligase [Hirschfeldia incana]|nr:Histidine-tRNA ligase [Hirschfeldia incana]KAJ0263719.1 Histidine-tRNA ligase [Hirschfeldia incana]KAJ0263720.1 Histidine-tRNA ligase [Hirschfeldia incana]
MSSGTVRRVSRQDIQLVQNLIERCLQLYMNQKEVVETLLEQAKIEPGFTELVWQKLEEENREFFKAYYLRLMVKHQIMEFNKLLEQQVHHMQQMHPTGLTSSVQNTNGSHIQSMNQKQLGYASEHTDQSLKPNAHHPMPSNLSNAYLNGSSTLNTTNVSPSVNISTHARRADASPNMLSSSQTTNMPPMMQGMNGGGMIKSETAFTNPPSFMYGGGERNNALDGHSAVRETPIPSFSNESNNNQQPLSDTLLDAEASTFGFLGQIPRNFSLSDLTADFSQSSDILESYDKSPFLVPDSENFLDSCDRGEYQGDNKRLDTISEGFSYDNLGSSE